MRKSRNFARLNTIGNHLGFVPNQHTPVTGEASGRETRRQNVGTEAPKAVHADALHRALKVGAAACDMTLKELVP